MYLIIDANNRLGKNESKNAYLVEREMVDEVIARIRFFNDQMVQKIACFQCRCLNKIQRIRQ